MADNSENKDNSEKQEEKKEFKLFREKSLEAVQTPEDLNEYLKVTSVGVWLVLSAVIVLLAGTILWSIFGRITTKKQLAVMSENGAVMCIVPYADLQDVTVSGKITIGDSEYSFVSGAEPKILTIDEMTNPFVLVYGGLQVGQLTAMLPVDADLPDGVYAGTVVTEELQPISMLFN